MPASEFSPLLQHLGSLIAEARWEAAYLHARLALDKAQNGDQARRLLQVCQQVPDEVRLTRPWAALVALTAFRADAPEVCEAHLRVRPEGQEALQAWVCIQREDFEGALALSERALVGALAGIAWRMRAWAMVKLQKAGWEDAYREAARRNEGRQRGFCLLQLGAFLSYAGDEAGARAAYAEATPAFAHDPELRANALYNVGTACLRLRQLDDAERAYQAAVTWARKPAGVRMLARAWSGLGHVYRARSEFPRALHAYDMAQTKATAKDDVAQAWRGKAHTLRLVGRLDEALATLHEGLERLGRPATHGLYADVAAIRVMLGDKLDAERALLQVSQGQAEEEQRAWIVRAELARRRGDLATAAALLRGVHQDALWTVEEARLLPDLFGLIGVHVPPPPALRLQVNADGPVTASLNGRRVALRSTTPSASLLTLLAWHGGSVAVESVLEWVALEGQTLRRRRQNLSRALGELREVLGWPGAVQTDGRRLNVDGQVVCGPPSLPARAEDFCAGLNDRWIEEWREQHDELDLRTKFSR